jgi:homoserine O-acetyltransferase
VLAINSADDERNPHETGLMAAAMGRTPNARLLLIPGSAETAGHGTTGQARFWRDALGDFLKEVP